MNNKADYYDVLGVSKNASDTEIKKAYRKQALEWHPDRHQGSDKEAAEKKFKEINEAYQVLSDPKKKSTYDQYGSAAFAPGSGSSGGGSPFGQGGFGPFSYYYSSGNPSGGMGGFDFQDPFDIFEQFFGGSPFQGGRVKSKPRYSLDLDFLEAVHGVEKEVSINGKRKKIKIPPGIDEGSRIEFNDFSLSFNIKPHSIFERDGADIYVNVEIPYSLAVKGGEVEAPTVDGSLKIRIREGVKPGSMLRLRGKGIPYLKNKGRGDEYIRILISVPEKLSREQKNIIEEMEKVGL